MKPREVKIKVTQRDIDRGIVEDCRSCPIALATRRTRIMPLGDLFVGSTTLDFNGRWMYDSKAARFIDRFDAGLSVRPFTFIATRKETKWTNLLSFYLASYLL